LLFDGLTGTEGGNTPTRVGRNIPPEVGICPHTGMVTVHGGRRQENSKGSQTAATPGRLLTFIA
jgi:hypothetical protein